MVHQTGGYKDHTI